MSTSYLSRGFLCIFFFLTSITSAYGSDYEEKRQSDCRINFGAPELEYAYGSCFQLKKSKRGNCVEAAEYRISQNDDFLVMIDYIIIRKVECRFNHSVGTTSNFKNNIERWPYIKENLVDLSFLQTAPILGKNSKLYDVELNGMSGCVGLNVVTRKHWLLLNGVVCSKANADINNLVEISSSLKFK